MDNICYDHGRSSCRGYTKVKLKGVDHYVHRLICAITHNLPYDGDWVTRHTCDNKRCIRVEHLIPGTKSDNEHDAHERLSKTTRNGRPRMSDEAKAQIKADTRVNRIIADEYGVHEMTVSRIKRGVQ